MAALSKIFLLFCVFCGSFSAFSEVPITYQANAAISDLGFTSYTSAFNVRAKFKNFDVSLKVPGGKFEKAVLNITIATVSVDSNWGARDNHLRTEDFFWSEKYANATFKSTNITEIVNNEYRLKGELNIRGVKKDIVTKVTLKNVTRGRKNYLLAQGTFKVSRSEFGLNYKSGILIPNIKDPVDIHFNIYLEP